MDGDSLESSLDRATERYAAAIRTRLDRKRGDPTQDATTALALVQTPVFQVGQLRWKGVEVSDEFLRYAARVARGEQLTPYRGQVLAQPSALFPWSPELHAKVDGPPPSRAQRRKRSSLAGWARGAASLILCTLLVGVGAAAMAEGERDLRPDFTIATGTAAPRSPIAPAPITSGEPAELALSDTAPMKAQAPARTSRRTKSLAPRAQGRPRALTTARAPSAASAATPAPAPFETTTRGNARQVSRANAALEARSMLAAPPAAPAMTIVGSTLLPALGEVSAAAQQSPLLLETPPF